MSEWVLQAEQWATWTQEEATAAPAEALDAFDAEVAQRLESAGFAGNLEQTSISASVPVDAGPSAQASAEEFDGGATLVRPSPTLATDGADESAVTQIHGAVPPEIREALEVSLQAPEAGLEVELDHNPDADVDGLVLPSLTTAPAEPEVSESSPTLVPGETVIAPAPEPALEPTPAPEPIRGETVIAPAPTGPEPQGGVMRGQTVIPTEPPARTGSTLPPVPSEPEPAPEPEEDAAAGGQAMSSGVFSTIDIHDDEEPEPQVSRQKVVIGAPNPPPEDDDTSELLAEDLVEDPEPEAEPEAPPPPPPKEAAVPPPPKEAAKPPPPKEAPKPPPAPPTPVVEAAPEPTPEPEVVTEPAAPVTPVVRPTGAPKAPGWPEEVFVDHAVAMARPNHHKLAHQEIEFFLQSAGLRPGSRVLDVGCGDGAHALALAQRGYGVTGVDLSASQLARAEHARDMIGANVAFLKGDMRDLPVAGPYEGIVCLGTSFGYYDDEENRAVLRALGALLAPGGRLMLQVFNRDHIIGRLPTRSWWQGQGCLVLDEAQMNFFTNRLAVHRTVVFEDGRQFEHRMQIRGYNAHELGRMCVEAGLRVVEISGSRLTRGRFYGASSADIWLLVEPKV